MVERTTPTLSGLGWLHNEDTAERADAAMAYAFTSDYSQSVTYAGKITSIQWLISKYSGNSLELQSIMQDTLTKYLKKQFDGVDLEVKVVAEGAMLDIRIKGTITNNGKVDGLSYLLTVRNSAVEKVTNTLNGEQVYVQ